MPMFLYEFLSIFSRFGSKSLILIMSSKVVCSIINVYFFGSPIYMYLISCCLSIRIKLNRNIIFFYVPMKINKNTANAYYEKFDK